MSELRFALVGAGFWARYQLAAWQEHAGVRCVAVCDRDRARAEALAGTRGVPAAYADAAEMIRRERPDFLDVVTDPAGHAPLVRLAAELGVPVICQKPMAPTPAECEDLGATCRAAGVPFLVHENWRWQAPLRRVRELLAEGVVGTPFRCRIDFVSGFDVYANQPGLRAAERFIVADMGCHLFDVARSWFGEAATVYCRTARTCADIRGEDVATAVLAMNGGRTTVTINMAYAGTPLERECFPETLVFIEGDRGSVEVAPGCEVRVTTRDGTRVTRARPPKFAWAEPDYAVVQASMVACQADLLRALRGAGPCETDAADNLRTMRLVFAAYDSAAAGEAVQVGG
jgi:predicted dehydrogenase